MSILASKTLRSSNITSTMSTLLRKLPGHLQPPKPNQSPRFHLFPPIVIPQVEWPEWLFSKCNLDGGLLLLKSNGPTALRRVFRPFYRASKALFDLMSSALTFHLSLFPEKEGTFLIWLVNVGRTHWECLAQHFPSLSQMPAVHRESFSASPHPESSWGKPGHVQGWMRLGVRQGANPSNSRSKPGGSFGFHPPLSSATKLDSGLHLSCFSD